MADILEDKPNAQPEVQPVLAKMIPDTKYKKVLAELAEAREKIRKLNEENNALVLQYKRLEKMRGKPGS
jgi:regulator of replication initiation timing